MKKPPKISDSEWEVMKVLWERSPQTANEIVESLSKKTPWKRETIRTLINRLVRKKAVAFEKKDRQYHFFPLANEADCVRAETNSFLRRVRVTSIEPMLAAFVEGQHLSVEQIMRLRRILDEKDPSGKRGKTNERTA
ncbi:MAG: BlaI/MecI/CopY family transcriptional regulator [Phycisphaerae bacterium]|nr:BlaI/MecI/CopY family transcriptional regulator [Phycisphaerae bacterium]